ncbi:MAG: cyclodeaminase/cyclohydrolase family protein [Candidatus Bipolaricaulia bacterium]
MSLLQEPLSHLLERLSSGSPTPGGGAAAALAGALAAALVSMVAGLTLGKQGYEESEEEMGRALAEAKKLRDRLAQLIEEDVAAFDGVLAAYRLQRGDPTRPEKIEAALKRACAVPLETAEHCLRALELSQLMAAKGNKNASSDAGAAATLAAAGLEAALLNVEINLRAIRDQEFVRGCRERAKELAAAGERLKAEALATARGGPIIRR